MFHFFSFEKGDLLEIVKKNFDLRPGAIIRDLDLLRPIYSATAVGNEKIVVVLVSFEVVVRLR